MLALSLVWSAVAFAAVAWLSAWGAQAGTAYLVASDRGWMQWLGWAAGVGGVLGALLLSLWLFVPVALVIATLYMERIAAAVDQRFYPALPPPTGASWTVQAWDGVALGARVLVLQLVLLVLAFLLPGVGWVLGLLVAGWAIGRGLFVAVAMRRMSRADATRLYRRRRPAVLFQGLLLSLASTVPLLNLFVPVLGMAAMVHVLNRRHAGL